MSEVPTEIGSTIAKERLIFIIAANEHLVADAKALLEILNVNPELDASFCRLFQIQPSPKK